MCVSACLVQLTVHFETGKTVYNVPFQLGGIPLITDAIRRLEAALLPKSISHSRRQVFVLHGFGGIGKTQLAAEFARKYQATFSPLAEWVYT